MPAPASPREQTIPADERAEIQAATDRLLDGTPLRSDGKLTVVSLAAEAGVKRHVLTHKHTDLKDRFYARVKARDSVPASETALREQNAELRPGLKDMRAERDEYKQAADALARALNILTIENDPDHRERPTAPQGSPDRPVHGAKAAAPVTRVLRKAGVPHERKSSGHPPELTAA